jgi:hypothetical protein
MNTKFDPRVTTEREHAHMDDKRSSNCFTLIVLIHYMYVAAMEK